jgi:iron(III) transport system substrate-binding protein
MRTPVRPVTALLALALSAATAGCGIFGGSDEESGDIQVYSARHYDLEEAFGVFEEETGLEVDFLTGDDAELLQRLEAEGEGSPADLFLTVDAGNLWAADEAGVLEPVRSQVLDDAVPAEYRAGDGAWYGLALRARTVVYNPDNVDPAEFDTENTYAGLGDPKWQGRLCMRDSTGTYTQSLMTALMETYGRDEAKSIAQSWLDNDVDIMSNDILLLEAVDAGTCDVAIANHYYLAREKVEKPDMDVELFWASQDGAGVQLNLSGGGVVTTSDAKADAQKLLEWLATDGQEEFVGDNHEFPVNPDVEPGEAIAAFGPYEPMPIDAEAYGRLNADAIDLLEEVGYE